MKWCPVKQRGGVYTLCGVLHDCRAGNALVARILCLWQTRSAGKSALAAALCAHCDKVSFELSQLLKSWIPEQMSCKYNCLWPVLGSRTCRATGDMRISLWFGHSWCCKPFFPTYFNILMQALKWNHAAAWPWQALLSIESKMHNQPQLLLSCLPKMSKQEKAFRVASNSCCNLSKCSIFSSDCLLRGRDK